MWLEGQTLSYDGLGKDRKEATKLQCDLGPATCSLFQGKWAYDREASFDRVVKNSEMEFSILWSGNIVDLSLGANSSAPLHLEAPENSIKVLDKIPYIGIDDSTFGNLGVE